MKKIACIIVAITLFLSANAQSHLTFMGEPIDGTMKHFTQRMNDKGMVLVQDLDGVNLFLAEYGGYENCVVGVVSREDKDLVYSILVCFVGVEDWSTLNSVYSDLNKQLSKDYGKPTEVVENFLVETHGDDEKFQAVVSDKCEYLKSYATELGEIDITIMNMPDMGPCVIIQYTDNENALK
ncbi:MAG: hypothetical protein K6A41_09655 [Bacteroidales bacterium]|nr:hypothetical protein [Bacteroidales bacterium]